MCWNLWESVIDFESNEHFVWRIYQEMPYGEWYYLVLYCVNISIGIAKIHDFHQWHNILHRDEYGKL